MFDLSAHIKATPDDFFVEEQADLPLRERGDFTVYRLEKRGWNTVDALRDAARRLKISARACAYGGKKDRQAHTIQYVTIRGARAASVKAEGYVLQRCGFMERPMGPDLLRGNRFRIIVRGLAPEECAQFEERMPAVCAQGFINYFDDQRFGSWDPSQGFMAVKLLKSHWPGALKQYMTAPRGTDSPQDRRRKKAISGVWKNWPACR
ncbi:MAG: tRNA pseudouridine(13) synthase TruD, partial [Candidatus Omnitrophica bacterium]|nr:tRNA pseudouridine(13) synthase TruD [Candidatus Omnitrophota bacterium]